eukprot:gene30479-35494_t
MQPPRAIQGPAQREATSKSNASLGNAMQGPAQYKATSMSNARASATQCNLQEQCRGQHNAMQPPRAMQGPAQRNATSKSNAGLGNAMQARARATQGILQEQCKLGQCNTRAGATQGNLQEQCKLGQYNATSKSNAGASTTQYNLQEQCKGQHNARQPPRAMQGPAQRNATSKSNAGASTTQCNLQEQCRGQHNAMQPPRAMQAWAMQCKQGPEQRKATSKSNASLGNAIQGPAQYKATSMNNARASTTQCNLQEQCRGQHNAMQPPRAMQNEICRPGGCGYLPYAKGFPSRIFARTFPLKRLPNFAFQRPRLLKPSLWIFFSSLVFPRLPQDHRNYEPLEVRQACYCCEASVALESLSASKSDVHRTTQTGDSSWEEP